MIEMTERQKNLLRMILSRIIYGCKETNLPLLECVGIGESFFLLEKEDKKALVELQKSLFIRPGDYKNGTNGTY